MLNFWEKLPKPFFVSAPMLDGTDAAFRRVIAECGKPDVMWTEFVSADGLCHPQGRTRLTRELYFTEAERPIVAQLFTSSPEKIEEAARLIHELGFDGIDINMGCPDRAIEKQGSGSSLIQRPEQALAIIRAAQKGGKGLPVSVKTRTGYRQNEIERWIPQLLASGIAALTVHLRTRHEMSKVPAHWELAAKVVELARGSGVKIIGNGDVATLNEARSRAKETGVDGVMIGRGMFGCPWVFSDAPEPSLEEKLNIMLRHAQYYEELYGDTETNHTLFGGRKKSFLLMRKHMSAYVKGIAHATELRTSLMRANSAQDVKEAIEQWRNGNFAQAKKGL